MQVSVDAERSSAQLAAQWRLPQLGGRPPLLAYLSKLWDRRWFTIELARSRFRAENEQDRLGLAWTVIGPLINALVYGLIFGLLLTGSKTKPQPFVPYLVVGVFIFQFFSASLQNGSRAIISNQSLIRTLHFPRAVLPIAVVLQQMYALVPMVVVMCGLVLAWGENLTFNWLRMFPALLLMSIFNLGIAFVAARITIHVRDIANLIPFLTRLMFYVSGVFFEIKGIAAIGTRPNVLRIFQANPVNVYISLVRDALLQETAHQPPHATGTTWVLGVGWALVACVGGFIFFWRAEERYGRD